MLDVKDIDARTPEREPTPTPTAWRIVVEVDPALDARPDPAAAPPTDLPVLHELGPGEHIVGRPDERQIRQPDLAVADPGVSRRHARLVVTAEGDLSVADLLSANGTRVNGVEILAGAAHPLAPGDIIELGRWTRLTVGRD